MSHTTAGNEYITKGVFLMCLSLSICVAAPGWSQKEFPCDGSFYYVSTNTQVGSTLSQIQIAPGGQLKHRPLPLDNRQARHLTCLGYNVDDRKLYALDFDTYELIRIEADGKMTILGKPKGIDTTYTYHSGGMLPQGRSLTAIGRNPETQVDDRVYQIRVNEPPDYIAGFLPVVSDEPTQMSDLAVDPLLGVTYSFNQRSNSLMVTDPTGSTSTFGFEAAGNTMTSLFFDREGRLYGLGGGLGAEQSSLYEIDKTDGRVLRIGSMPAGRDTDGCACPYQVKIEKTYSPQRVAQCNRMEILYAIDNTAGIGQIGTILRDTLPPGAIIEEIDVDKAAGLLFGNSIGSNVLDISRYTLVMRQNEVRVIVRIDQMDPGKYASRGLLSRLPYALNHVEPTDDPNTAIPHDASQFEVVEAQDLQLEDHLRAGCSGDSVRLWLPLEGDYTWSTGDQTDTLVITEAGTYAVTVSSDCYQVDDEITIESLGDVLEVALPDTISLDLGEEHLLDFTTNRSDLTRAFWSGDSMHFSCLNCLHPIYTASQTEDIGVTVIDQNGCRASATTHIRVKEIRRVVAPNAISPNGDGLNDLFNIIAVDAQVLELYVFDRWGNVVYHDRDAQGWDGLTEGQPNRPEVYIWQARIRFADGLEEVFSGDCFLTH